MTAQASCGVMSMVALCGGGSGKGGRLAGFGLGRFAGIAEWCSDDVVAFAQQRVGTGGAG